MAQRYKDSETEVWHRHSWDQGTIWRLTLDRQSEKANNGWLKTSATAPNTTTATTTTTTRTSCSDNRSTDATENLPNYGQMNRPHYQNWTHSSLMHSPLCQIYIWEIWNEITLLPHYSVQFVVYETKYFTRIRLHDINFLCYSLNYV
jgi:hypothetical protein